MKNLPQILSNIALVLVIMLSSFSALAVTNNQTAEGLLYSGVQPAKSLDNVNEFVSPQEKRKLLDPTQIPAPKQPIVDRGDPRSKILEKTAQMFEDAGEFLNK